MVRFSVSKSAPELVPPSEPTPCGNLPLSFMDRHPALRVLITSIFVYRHGEEAAKVIKDALSKALDRYYPVAGRIVEAENGEVEIGCTGEGVWFVEATANCSLEDVNYLQLPLLQLSQEDLLPFAPPKFSSSCSTVGLLTLVLTSKLDRDQVTRFNCGGFVVGLRSCHTMFDGVGQAQFLKAVGEIARGLARPTVEPIWCRDAIPTPPKLPQGPPPALAPFSFETSVLDIASEDINRIKNLFLQETGQRCSTFDIITAKTWQCRTRAIGIDPREHVHIGFAVNTRHLLHHVLLPPQQGGYYGNCVYNMTVSAPSETIACASLVQVARLIREAKKRVPAEFSQWMTGEIRQSNKLPLGYGTLTVLDWSRVGLFEVDYGWGEPLHGAPLVDTNFIAWCILLKPLPPKEGVRLIMRCVEREKLAGFNDQMISLAS
ncbi:hypothetical protein BHM03_00052020 [Ensete ventricosum]|uniref:3'-N-debenzoyl-2'-deoxytaxol N-benzoyltransferase n=1 Tax=Ensete ventricosum TaxID=4639 RepID=A0A445MLY0_ENSVE|nr:hypothetical protein BHM03_00052020 [Ensete ventricosum]